MADLVNRSLLKLLVLGQGGGICLSPKWNVRWVASADSPAEAAWLCAVGDEGPPDYMNLTSSIDLRFSFAADECLNNKTDCEKNT